MKNWFSKLLGGGDEPPPPAKAAAPAPAPAKPAAPKTVVPEPVTIPLANHGPMVDAMFYQWLAGTGGATGPVPEGLERLILEKLAALAQSPASGAELVPRVPAVIPELFRSLRDEGTSGADLVRQIARDVVLVAEVIREANSPYYHPTAPIKTIDGAVMLLGQNGLRMLLARVAFRPIISTQTGHFAKMVAPTLWNQAELCAQAGNILALRYRAPPFESYLAGLTRNVGLVVAFRLIDQIYRGQALPQSAVFWGRLNQAASMLAGRIATLWEFPPIVAEAIERMHEANADGPTPLARALAAADKVSKMRMLADAGVFPEDDPFVTNNLDTTSMKCFTKLKLEDS